LPAASTIIGIGGQVKSVVDDAVTVIVFAITLFDSSVSLQTGVFAAICHIAVQVHKAGNTCHKVTLASGATRNSFGIRASMPATPAIVNVRSQIEPVVDNAVAVIILAIASFRACWLVVAT
jgi:hypothetical protein